MRKPSIRVTDQEIINAIVANHGNLKISAQKLKIDYGTICHRVSRCPEAQRAKEDAVADMITVAEDVVYNHLLDGNLNAAKFVLERRSPKWGNQPEKEDDWEPIGN